VFFLGGAWFRRLHFVKTSLVLTLLSLGLILFFALVVRLFFPEIAMMEGRDIDLDPDALYRRYQGTIEALGVLGRLLLFVGLPVFCSFVAWLRIRETQVSYGI